MANYTDVQDDRQEQSAPAIANDQAQAQVPSYYYAVGPRNKFGLSMIHLTGSTWEHRDQIHVDRAVDRNRLIREVSRKSGFPIDQLELLHGVLVRGADASDQTARDADQFAELPAPEENEPLVPDPVVEAAATEFLNSPQMIQQLLNDIRTLGVAGEATLGVTVYMIAVSRLLPHPLGGCIQSVSASGKSFVAEKIMKLVPPEDLVHATDITANALYYAPDGMLRHKIVYAGERKHAGKDPAETANQTRALREMLTSGKLSKLVTDKGPEGQLTTRLIVQTGPIAYVESTTAAEIFEEDATRLLNLSTDESAEHTATIMQLQAAQAAGLTADESARAFVIQKHQTAQRMLQAFDVRVPFATDLGLPATKVASRRMFPQLIAMIKVVALLRQRQKLVTDGRIDADLDDYAIAYEIMYPILRRSFAPLSDRAQAMYATIQANHSTMRTHFTRNDCKNWSGLGLTEVKNRLDVLVEAGVVEVVLGSQGVPFRYRLVSGASIQNVVLPGLITPADLRFRLNGRAAEASSEAPWN